MPHLDALQPLAALGFAILLNGLWQGALIAFVTWLALYIFRSANAATRYAVWSLSLLAVLIVPVVTSVSRVSMQPATTVTSARDVETHRPAVTKRVVDKTTHATIASHSVASSRPAFTLPSFALTLPAFIAPAIVALWLLAALVILGRLIVAFMQLERLKHDSLPLSVEYRDSMPRWMSAVKGARDVRICVSEAIEVPIAVGLFDSMVLLPSHLVHSLDPNEIDQISLHELGHLLRADDWTNAVQRIASALLFFNPAVWFISRQMDVEREVACDDYVLQLTGSVRPYAFCLTKMAEMTAWPHRPMPAPGVFVTRKNISIRIERLLRTGRAIGSSIAPSVAGSFVASLVAVFIVLRLMTPSIAFTIPAAPAAPDIASIPPPPGHLVTPKPVTENPHASGHAHLVIVRGEATPSAPAPHPPAVTHASNHVDVAPVNVDVPAVHAHVPAVHVDVPPARPNTPSVPGMPDVGGIVNNALAQANVIAKTKIVARNDEYGCTGCNFAGANLSGRDFSNRNLEGANFKGANLQSTRFDRSHMTGAEFVGADLRNASFRGADLEGCNLRGARLDGVAFDGARLTGCAIDAGKLSPDQARIVLTSCQGCDFANVDLRGMDLHGVRLEGLNMRGADLRNANLSGADLTGVELRDAKLSGANLNGANLTGCDLRGADLRGVDLSHTNLTGADMNNALWKD